MSDWRDVEARTRGIFREVNEQISNLHKGFGLGGKDEWFICECADSACTKAVQVSPAEYEAVRGYERRFLVAPNHEHAEIERVVTQNRRFAVVETFVGQAFRMAEVTDPRVYAACS